MLSNMLQHLGLSSPKDSDIVKLNVGGTTKLAVTRRVLTHFEGSKLATQFSGTSKDGDEEDSLQRDWKGRIFIDFDAKEFNTLIAYLRLCAYNTNGDEDIPSPLPTYAFCSMLAHYGLMNALYPPHWHCYWGDYIREVVSRDQESFESDHSGDDENSGVMFQSDESYPGLHVSSFRVVVKRGFTAQVGWSTFEAFTGDDEEVGYNAKYSNFALDLSSPGFFSKGNMITPGDGYRLKKWVDIAEKDVAMVCSNDGEGNYTITIEGADGGDDISESVKSEQIMYPSISFTGRVTVSNLQYRYPRSSPLV